MKRKAYLDFNHIVEENIINMDQPYFNVSIFNETNGDFYLLILNQDENVVPYMEYHISTVFNFPTTRNVNIIQENYYDELTLIKRIFQILNSLGVEIVIVYGLSYFIEHLEKRVLHYGLTVNEIMFNGHSDVVYHYSTNRTNNIAVNGGSILPITEWKVMLDTPTDFEFMDYFEAWGAQHKIDSLTDVPVRLADMALEVLGFDNTVNIPSGLNGYEQINFIQNQYYNGNTSYGAAIFLDVLLPFLLEQQTGTCEKYKNILDNYRKNEGE